MKQPIENPPLQQVPRNPANWEVITKLMDEMWDEYWKYTNDAEESLDGR